MKLKAELQYQSYQVGKILAANQQLTRDKKQLNQSCEIQQAIHHSLSHKVKFYEQLFKYVRRLKHGLVGYRYRYALIRF